MAQLGLRIGEAVAINISQISLETLELTLRTEKTRRLDMLLISLPLFRETIGFIKAHSKEIEASGGYLFFSDRKKSHGARKQVFLEPNYVRNRFRKYSATAKLDFVYDVSEEQNA